MNPTDIARQTQVESGMLNHLRDALRNTMAWEVKGDDFSRKLSTLRFIAQSFQRHIEHLFALEEYDGYMDHALKACPQLAKTVEALKTDHETLHHGVRHVLHRLERLAPTNGDGLASICADLQAQLQKLDEHNLKEIAVVQEALEREGGGEG